MSTVPERLFLKLRENLQTVLIGPQLLAFLPAITLGGYWFGGETSLILAALILPALFAVAGLFPKRIMRRDQPRDGLTGLRLRKAVVETLDEILEAEATSGRTTAALAIEIDDYSSLVRNFGQKAADAVVASVGVRIQDTLRDHDVVARIDSASFGVALCPIRRADLETIIQLSARIQAAICQPHSINATKIYVTASIGFCLPSRAPARKGEDFLEAAERALKDAQTNGAASIRAFSPEISKRAAAASALAQEVGAALENGEIRPWYQPQVSTHTGEISGFEALARWHHPKRGMIPPGEFLPAIAEAGLFERLGEVMLYHSLTALQNWEKAGFQVPNVGVNFSSAELANPKLCEKIRWELDRFDMSPEQLTIEILEDVIASSDNDIITQNIWSLSELGCNIDLDDFGTGHASIANIRRFAVDRIKIDRSYVTRVDVDREQQNMVAAILTMAERLNLDTLAEGVESVGEHSMLAQLGCGNVQGYSIARPMAYEDTLIWMTKHREKLSETTSIGRQVM